MKPNGMRAWRKTARRWRRKQNRHWRETGAPCIADGTGRWYRRQQAFFKQRPAAPSRPFTPRSLVGMSQQTRRWYARVDLVLRHSTETATNRSEGRALLLRWTELLANPEAREDYRQSLAEYRLGQRLRPCAGCLRCRSCAGCEALTFEGDICEDCGRETPMAVASCDGSGVLPARMSS